MIKSANMFCIFYNFGKDYENVKDKCEKF
jgi:hypothetical protein